MNEVALYTLLSVAAVSLISVLVVFTITWTKRLTFLVSFAAGALLGDVFIHLLPQLGADGKINLESSLYILLSIIIFFILENFIHWHHHHGDGENSEHKEHPFVLVNIIGDGLHNFIDGVIIAGAYLIDIQLGIATTIAVAAHEIPQEIGDFAIMIYGGFSRAKAILYNLFSALTAALGAILALYVGANEHALTILASLAIGSFIYIGAVDLMPHLNRMGMKRTVHFLAFLLGITVMATLLWVE